MKFSHEELILIGRIIGHHCFSSKGSGPDREKLIDNLYQKLSEAVPEIEDTVAFKEYKAEHYKGRPCIDVGS